MVISEIPLNSDSLYQITNFNAKVGRITRRLRVEVRYLYYTDKWYLSVFNAQTGEAYCRYVPLVSSFADMNNMISLYMHKDIGWLVCIPKIDNPSSEDPKKGNLNEFALVWGDGFD